MSACFTNAELQEITGREQGAAQCRFFERHGIHAPPSLDGHPRVMRSVWHDYQLGTAPRHEFRPDFSRYQRKA